MTLQLKYKETSMKNNGVTIERLDARTLSGVAKVSYDTSKSSELAAINKACQQISKDYDFVAKYDGHSFKSERQKDNTNMSMITFGFEFYSKI